MAEGTSDCDENRGDVASIVTCRCQCDVQMSIAVSIPKSSPPNETVMEISHAAFDAAVASIPDRLARCSA